MSNSNTEIQVVYLSREYLDDAIDVLSRALEQDPLMHFVFEKSDMDYLRSSF